MDDILIAAHQIADEVRRLQAENRALRTQLLLRSDMLVEFCQFVEGRLARDMWAEDVQLEAAWLLAEARKLGGSRG